MSGVEWLRGQRCYQRLAVPGGPVVVVWYQVSTLDFLCFSSRNSASDMKGPYPASKFQAISIFRV
ncbi:hypothetical protein NC651_015882 [Populus alba x Populus x berolinensis]|nr:hypothetical protein NC651_015882 [Populus alba x Populus x berolinensis]